MAVIINGSTGIDLPTPLPVVEGGTGQTTPINGTPEHSSSTFGGVLISDGTQARWSTTPAVFPTQPTAQWSN